MCKNVKLLYLMFCTQNCLINFNKYKKYLFTLACISKGALTSPLMSLAHFICRYSQSSKIMLGFALLAWCFLMTSLMKAISLMVMVMSSSVEPAFRSFFTDGRMTMGGTGMAVTMRSCGLCVDCRDMPSKGTSHSGMRLNK